MNKRPWGMMMAGILAAAVTAIAAPGCGRSIAGEYERICVATCEAGDDCEDYAGFLPVDREDCIRDCKDQAIEAEEQVMDLCDDGVDIDGAQADRCHDSILHLGDACRADDESEILEAVGDIGDECGQELYQCR